MARVEVSKPILSIRMFLMSLYSKVLGVAQDAIKRANKAGRRACFKDELFDCKIGDWHRISILSLLKILTFATKEFGKTGRKIEIS